MSDDEGENADANEGARHDERRAPPPGDRDPEGGAVGTTISPEQIIANASEPWRTALIRLRAEMPARNFADWFKNTYLVAARIVAVPDDYTARWLRERYARAIASALGVPTVEVVVVPDDVRGWFAGTLGYAIRTSMNPALAWRIGVVDVLDRLANEQAVGA